MVLGLQRGGEEEIEAPFTDHLLHRSPPAQIQWRVLQIFFVPEDKLQIWFTRLLLQDLQHTRAIASDVLCLSEMSLSQAA